jgi:uncharacterized iron-regulated membrane protein
MKGPFRQSMTWLHTWSSLILIWLLFAVFVTGTLSFYRTEITHWMQPEGHIANKVDTVTAADSAWDRLTLLAPWGKSWSVSLPSERNPKTGVSWVAEGEAEERRRGPRALINASNGEVLALRETAGGNFLYDFHFELYAMPRDVGRTIVGVASMLMLVAIISGVIMHRKIFSDFFTFRPRKRTVSWIDGHVIGSVLALPFHIMITFSGLVLLSSTLLFWNSNPGTQNGGRPTTVAPSQLEHINTSTHTRPAAVKPDLAGILADAEQLFGGPVASLNIQHPMTANARIQVTSATRDSLFGGRTGRQLHYDLNGNRQNDASPGDTAVQSMASSLATAVFIVLKVTHEARFADVITRMLFFIAGILGSAMVATGAVLWVVKRTRKQAGSVGYELVSMLNLTAIAGLMVAIGSYFWANRLLPADMESRDLWEIRVFFLTWLLTLLHAYLARKQHGWFIQLSLAATLFICIPILDGLTSPVGLWAGLVAHDWPRIGFDLIALITGFGLLMSAFWVRQHTLKRIKNGKGGTHHNNSRAPIATGASTV